MSTVFITGGSGFLGSRLFAAMRLRGDSIIALDRSGSMDKPWSGELDGVKTVRADLLETQNYEEALARVDVVLHLAALTGRATEKDHFRVNLSGTQALLATCRRAGVKRFLFVSSIATKFPDENRYHYAQAKLRAEEAVRNSGLQFVIVRPTMIFGRGSPILKALETLASLPVILVVGDGDAKVQPIYVDDLVVYLLMILDQDLFRGETLELGGPTVLTIEELLQKIRSARRGATAHSLHLPMSVLLRFLEFGEAVGLGRLLPVSVGQLSSFRYDGAIESNPLYESRRANLRDLPQMLSLSFAAS